MLRSSTLPDVYDITPYLRYPMGTAGPPARERSTSNSQPSGMLGRAVQLWCDGYLSTTTPTVSDIADAIERSDLVRHDWLAKGDMGIPAKVELAAELRRLNREGYLERQDTGNASKLAAARARYAILVAAKEAVISALCDKPESTPSYWDLALVEGQRTAKRVFGEHKSSLPGTPWDVVESDLLAKIDGRKQVILRNERVVAAQAERRRTVETSPGTPPVNSGRRAPTGRRRPDTGLPRL